MQVPPQIEGERCGYYMLYNMNRVCEQQEIQAIGKEEEALEGYMIEITKMVLKKQQDRREGEEGRVRKKGRVELTKKKE